MKKTCWFFGDSTTFGHGLKKGFEYYDENPHLRKPLWTYLVSQHFRSDLINFASCGASNEDILFRLITQLSKIKKGDRVVIQSTYPSRINIFTNDDEYKSIHMAFGEDSELNNRITDEQLKSLKSYIKNFLIDNVDKLELRNIIYFESIKRELESRGVDVIVWNHEVMNDKIRNKMGWATISDESLGFYDDYHIGFESQYSFYEFIISEYNNGNKFINPNPDFYENIESLRFDYHEPIQELDKLFNDIHSEFVEVDTKTKYLV